MHSHGSFDSWDVLVSLCFRIPRAVVIFRGEDACDLAILVRPFRAHMLLARPPNALKSGMASTRVKLG